MEGWKKFMNKKSTIKLKKKIKSLTTLKHFSGNQVVCVVTTDFLQLSKIYQYKIWL